MQRTLLNWVKRKESIEQPNSIDEEQQRLETDLENPTNSSENEQEQANNEEQQRLETDLEKPANSSDNEQEQQQGQQEEEQEEQEEDGEDGEDGIPEYERLRLANISQNLAFLESLGLDSGTPIKPSKSFKRPRSNTRSRKRIVAPSLRKSARLSSKASPLDPTSPTPQLEPEIQESPLEVQYSYDDSSVLTYTVQSKTVKAVTHVGNGIEEHCDGDSFERLEKDRDLMWEDDQMKKVYAIDIHAEAPIFATGGHGGRVAVFGLMRSNVGQDGDSAEDPLLRFKACKGWTSSVHFFYESHAVHEGDPVCLLTASNDSVLALWDVGKADTQSSMAKLLFSTDDLHNSGIFSMHYLRGYRLICTGGKDRTVMVSQVGPSGFQVVEAFEDAHAGVVKSVRMRDGNVLASTGNDLQVHLFDIRDKKRQLTVEDAHTLCVNSVRWHPDVEHVLMTTSFSPEIKLWDIRKPAEPVLELTSHYPKGVGRCKSIYHPCFVQNGDRILTSGDGSDSLTLYNTLTGKVVSRGEVGFQCSALAVQGRAVLAAHNKHVHHLRFAKGMDDT